MPSVSIEVHGYEECLDAFERYGDHSYHVLEREGLQAALNITGEAKILAPMWLGDLKADISFDFPETSRLGFDMEVTADAGHAAYVEYDTRPHMPPIDAITPWALDHGIDPWALARHIRFHGTAAHPFMRPAFLSEVPNYLEHVIAGLNEPVL
jgi:hypothetical protein